jgi:hypothetical protein
MGLRMLSEAFWRAAMWRPVVCFNASKLDDQEQLREQLQ